MTPQPPPGQTPISPPPPPPPGYPPRGAMPPMPPMGMMPPMMMMPPPPRQGGGFAKAILLTLATTVFGLSLLLNVYLLIAVSMTQSESSDFKAIETPVVGIAAGDPSEKVAVVKLDGQITDGSQKSFVSLLDHVRKDARVKALVLEVNSPGGGVTPSDEMYAALVRFKQERKIPVVVSMGSLAASGGYYVSMAGDRIWAQDTTLTGSIGVLFQRADLSEFANRYGIKDGTIVSDGATYKDAGSMLRPLTDDEAAYFKTLLNDAFAVFKDRIKKGRPNLSDQEIDLIANGKIYSAKQALALKLVDKLGYLNDAIADAAALAKLNKPHAVRVERELSFAEKLFGADAKAGNAASLSAGGVNVKVDRELVDDLLRPRLMYLWGGR